MKASATQTFVAVVAGAYILGQEGQPLEVTEDQARVLLRDGIIVLAEGEYLPENKPQATPKPKREQTGGVL
jgi:hypothetical protein